MLLIGGLLRSLIIPLGSSWSKGRQDFYGTRYLNGNHQDNVPNTGGAEGRGG